MFKPIVSLPMVICCGRLVVVSSIPPGDFFFIFWAKLLFWGAQRRAARDFGGGEKATVGGGTHRSRLGPPTPKAALLARETARFAGAPRALGGALGGRTGRFEPLDSA